MDPTSASGVQMDLVRTTPVEGGAERPCARGLRYSCGRLGRRVVAGGAVLAVAPTSTWPPPSEGAMNRGAPFSESAISTFVASQGRRPHSYLRPLHRLSEGSRVEGLLTQNMATPLTLLHPSRFPQVSDIKICKVCGLLSDDTNVKPIA